MVEKKTGKRSEVPEMQATARERWEQIADWWDDTIGDGNRTQDELVEPNQMDLLNLKPGERVLEAACGAGRFARRMAAAGAKVIAFDQSEAFISALPSPSLGTGKHFHCIPVYSTHKMRLKTRW